MTELTFKCEKDGTIFKLGAGTSKIELENLITENGDEVLANDVIERQDAKNLNDYIHAIDEHTASCDGKIAMQGLAYID